jgi:hypothetical protein
MRRSQSHVPLSTLAYASNVQRHLQDRLDRLQRRRAPEAPTSLAGMTLRTRALVRMCVVCLLCSGELSLGTLSDADLESLLKDLDKRNIDLPQSQLLRCAALRCEARAHARLPSTPSPARRARTLSTGAGTWAVCTRETLRAPSPICTDTLTT